MSARANTIETKSDYENAIKDNGAIVGDRMFFTRGEGKQTRYFVRGPDGEEEKVSKGEAMGAFEGAENVLLPEEPDTIGCRVCGAELGYITASHLDTHEEGPSTVAEYREFVAGEDGVDPEDVPLASDDMYARFASGGHENDDETREKIGSKVSDLWASGHYDHLRADDDNGDGAEA